MNTITLVSLTPPKVGQVFTTQKSDTQALCLRVDHKPNGNLAIQYISIEKMRKFIESDDNNYTPPTEWTTWYEQRKYDSPKYGGVMDWSHTANLINDTKECTCSNCDNYYEVEGLTDTEEG